MKKYFFVILWLISVVLILIFSQTVSDITYKTLSETLKEVFPVLFPYSVIASLMVSMGGGEILGKMLPVNKLFLMPSSASAPILCGALCGFPLGAKTACDMYECGYYSKDTAQKIISISNNTGPAFVISIIGMKYFNSAEVGIVMYISQFLSVIIASLAVNGRICENGNIHPNSINFGCAFSEAIKSAFLSCLYVCGYISVFSSVIYASSNLPQGMYGALCALLEFTNGAKYGGSIGGMTGLFISAFSVGWSGLSVIAQTMSYTYPLGLSVNPLIKIKIIEGLLCGVMCSLYFTQFRVHLISGILLLTASLYIIRNRQINKSKIIENSICY